MGAKKLSAGILVYRRLGGEMEVFLVHPGGPFWAKKDEGAWSIPKGEYTAGEDPLTVAKREFQEELGRAPEGDFHPLGEIMQSGGKAVVAWAAEGNFDVANLQYEVVDRRSGPRRSSLVSKERDGKRRRGWKDFCASRERVT